jgi:hypothetical protein
MLGVGQTCFPAAEHGIGTVGRLQLAELDVELPRQRVLSRPPICQRDDHGEHQTHE